MVLWGLLGPQRPLSVDIFVIYPTWVVKINKLHICSEEVIRAFGVFKDPTTPVMSLFYNTIVRFKWTDFHLLELLATLSLLAHQPKSVQIVESVKKLDDSKA